MEIVLQPPPGGRQDLLRRITERAAVLNRRAELATEEIERLEKRLVATEAGIEVDHGSILREEVERLNPSSGQTEPALRLVTLGFGKVGGKWGVVVREQVFGKKRPRDTTWNKELVNESVLLRKADRHLRILAVPHLDGLVASVADALDRALAHVSALGGDSSPDPTFAREGGAEEPASDPPVRGIRIDVSSS